MSAADEAPRRLSLAAVLRELRRSLAEVEAAEDAARRKRRTLIDELDRLVQRTQDEAQELQLAASAEAALAAAENAAERVAEAAVPSGPPAVPRVLIAEDSSTAGRVARRLVERLGYAVDWARDGVEALERLERAHYDAVLMDCKMPRMDGYQATRALRQLPGDAAGVPVIALTANNLEGDDLRCFVAGMDDYLAKPVHPEQLEACLARWVGARRA